ncbi:3ce53d52-4d07-49bd-aa3e-254f7383582b [Thermothielavioides terrestris]|uniref:Uncharacterized protein n=2 Tax=Thermothielavioides terrestris TaxID=2587410 RepID=G2R4G6_THETT|nr:uncharacterized protein THITE_2115466 [Thermothielavioides terrestris NRRL 8126]AEO66910.1 hypothetical protein THITE_2115466 [Thermothielavioides terrestris NRRL 8126]SPQ23609.1 3ce53d52-4d07-49bd-aa3e-254f7383582b [Thermothielavioides terrestris]
MKPTRGTTFTPSAPLSALRVFRRHPILTATGVFVASACLGFRHMAARYRANQEKYASDPDNHCFVPVERSGGGI